MDESFSYDGNGNIKTTLRHGGFTAPRDMDDLAYNYNVDGSGHLVNNKLRHIHDNITFYPDNNTHDLSNQVTDNYHYDAIGNLIADQETGISNVDWTVYGKIKAITKTSGNGPSLAYTYDPAGQRATKLVNGVTTWYVRDASGNTMAVYDNKGGTTNWREQDLYGSSRLGLWEPNMNLASNNASTIWDTIGHKQYELNNHLGNVLATITDKRIPHSSDGTTIDYYNPETTTAQDYYAFGFQVPMRGYTLGKPYRYGFNGKENDSDVKVDFDGNNIPGAQQDYGMRIYDPRVGRFLSVDPLTKSFPELTPYQFSSNSPIANVDLDGKEKENFLEHMLRLLLGRGPQPTTAEEANFRSNEVQATHQVFNNVDKLYEREEDILGVVPGMSFFFEDVKGNHKAAAAYFVLDVFGEELFRYAGKGLKYIHPEKLFKVEVSSVELFGKETAEGEFVITKFKNLDKIGKRAWYKYQAQINGLSGSHEFIKKGVKGFVKFDGFKNGVLLEAKSLYQWLFKTGRATEKEIFGKMTEQLGRQIDAAAGTKLEWHFAEDETMKGFEKYLKNNAPDYLKNVELKYTPAHK